MGSDYHFWQEPGELHATFRTDTYDADRRLRSGLGLAPFHVRTGETPHVDRFVYENGTGTIYRAPLDTIGFRHHTAKALLTLDGRVVIDIATRANAHRELLESEMRVGPLRILAMRGLKAVPSETADLAPLLRR